MFPGGYYPPQTLQEGCGNYNWGGYAYPIMPSPSPSCCTTHGYAAPAPSSSPSPPPSMPYYHHHIMPPAPAPYFYHLPYYFQHPAWPPVPLPLTPTNCCCACSNHHHQQPLHQDKLITPDENYHKPIPYQQNPPPVDVVTAIPNHGSTSAPTFNSPPLVWYYNSPQPHNQQHQTDPGLPLKHNQQGPQHSSPPAHIIPYQPDKPDNSINKTLAAGFNRDGTRNYFTNFPFPVILMPYNGDQDNKYMGGQSEEKSYSGDIKALPEEYVDDETWQPLPVKSLEPENNAGIPKGKPLTENGKVRVKYIPVKQEGEMVAKLSTSADAAIKTQRSRSVSPTNRTPKLPPVCLRVDPLPRKKAGNGASSPPAHKRNLQQSPEDSNAKNNEGRIEKTAKNMKARNPSFINENLKNNPVCEDGKPGERRQSNEVEAMESVKMQSAQTGTTVGCMEKDGSKTKNKISEEEAAVRIQSAYRGYEERRWQSLQKLREIAQVREKISTIKDRIHALENDPDMHKDYGRQRLMIGETIMSLLLKLDTIQGLHSSIRDVRKSVAKELISLQEKLDSFHSRRSSKKGEIQVDDSQGDAEDINQVERILCGHLSENEHSEKHEDGDTEKVTEPDGKAEDKEEKLDKTVDSVGAGQHQAVVQVEDATPTEQNQEVCKFQPMDALKGNNALLHASDLQVEEENGPSLDKHINAMAMMEEVAIMPDSGEECVTGTDSCRKAEEALHAGDKDESKVKDTADDTKDNGKDTEVITFGKGEPCSEALDGSIDAAPKYETMENCDIDNDQPTVSAEEITPKEEAFSPLSNSSVTQVEGGGISEQMSELGQEAPNVNNESVVEVCATTLENGPINMKEQSEPEEMLSTKSPEEEVIAISSPCASPTVPQIHY
uniref:BAG domain-containing protein n=1 Tax=Kalanchoe fedtschenkoi TaxID=63787 RepID=A0A7N0TUK8_KALFE